MTNNKRGRGQSAMTPGQWDSALANLDSLKKPMTLAEQARRLGVTPPAIRYQRDRIARQEQVETFAAA